MAPSATLYLSSILWLLIEDFQDSFEMQADVIKPGQNVVVIDDLLATGDANRIPFCSCTNTNH